MPLNGTLATMALPDLLQWLSGARKTGYLRLTNGRFRKQIIFAKGVIASCSSDDPREYLGQFLLSQQMISEDQLRQAMDTQRATGVMLGRILMMVNAITEEDLRAMLTRKAEETLFGLFLWPHGSFEFEEKVLELDNLLPLTLKVEDVLLEGLRRYDELQVILKEFASDDFVLQRTDRPLPHELTESTEVRNLLLAVDGQRTLTDICLELRLSEFKVSRLAYRLFKLGCVVLADEVITDELVVPVADAAALTKQVDALMAGQQFEAALDLLSEALQTRGHDLGLQAKLEAVEADFMARAYQHYLPPQKILTLKAPLGTLVEENLTPQEMFLLSRINDAWTVEDIVTISPLREVEALRVLKRLRERGLVGLDGDDAPRPGSA